MIAGHVTELIGGTPLLLVPEEVHGVPGLTLYAKLEYMNPFGSVKDRIAWGMIKEHVPDLVRRGATVYENSSGNTAKALQAICGTFGLKVKLITYLSKVTEVKELVKLVGADVQEVLGGSECFDPNDPNDPQYIIERAVRDDPERCFFPSQFTNPKNVEVHYETTGREIAEDLPRVDYFFGGLGTSGSTLGAARRIRGRDAHLSVIGVVASRHDFIPGIRSLDQMWESGLFVRSHYDGIVSVRSVDAVDAMAELVRRVGMTCGPTTGATYRGLLDHFRENPPGRPSVAVFVACDRLEWYAEYVRERRPGLLGGPPRPGSLADFDDAGSADGPDVHGPETLAPDRAAAFLSESGAVVIDVRGPEAFATSSLPGAVNVPKEFFEKMIDASLPFSPDAPVLLVCAVGAVTGRYARYLSSKGAVAVRSVGGGMLAWRGAGLPLRRGQGAAATPRALAGDPAAGTYAATA